MEDRAETYDALFSGELPNRPQPDEASVGLSGLWRIWTEKRGARGGRLTRRLNTVPEAVANTLKRHEDHARSETDDNNAIFGLTHPEETLPILTHITSETIKLWEAALYRNNRAPLTLLDEETAPSKDEHEATDAHQTHLQSYDSLITETAGAVLQVLPVWAKDPYKPSKTEQKNLSMVLANWGPRFLTEWMNGSIITEWLRQQNATEEEIIEWQAVFTPSIRKRLIVSYVDSPLDALGKVKNNWEKLSDENIAAHLGWSEEEASSIFNSGMRKHLAVHYINDPIDPLERVRDNLARLTSENITNYLDWPEEVVESIFTAWIRKHFAVHNINDPFHPLKQVKDNLELLTDANIATYLGLSEAEARNKFSPSTRKYFAVNYINDPLQGMKSYIQGDIKAPGKI